MQDTNEIINMITNCQALSSERSQKSISVFKYLITFPVVVKPRVKFFNTNFYSSKSDVFLIKNRPIFKFFISIVGAYIGTHTQQKT